MFREDIQLLEDIQDTLEEYTIEEILEFNGVDPRDALLTLSTFYGLRFDIGTPTHLSFPEDQEDDEA